MKCLTHLESQAWLSTLRIGLHSALELSYPEKKLKLMSTMPSSVSVLNELASSPW